MAGNVAAEVLPEPSGPGSVVLDIGGDVGAAAVYVPASFAGVEIEIRPDGEPWAGRHVAVRERQLPDAVVWAALFPTLDRGDYEIRIRHGDPDGPTGRFTVTGGRVSTLRWLGASLAQAPRVAASAGDAAPAARPSAGRDRPGQTRSVR